MALNEKNQKKADYIVNLLREKNFFVNVFDNGHIQVNGWNFWCTTERYYNMYDKRRGRWLNNFVEDISKK